MSQNSAVELARRIQRMAHLVRSGMQALAVEQLSQTPAREGQSARSEAARPGSEGSGAEPARQPGWWVLAQGRKLDPADFEAREAAREDLLHAVLKAGVLLDENIWVWDETNRAQLVLATLPSQERALRVAERLREKGLNIAVRREMP